jgi:hypothetical protein
MQHAVGYVTGGQFYGAKASLNVWPAQVSSPAEFSLSQIWVISGSFGNDLNTIEAGWQVHNPTQHALFHHPCDTVFLKILVLPETFML